MTPYAVVESLVIAALFAVALRSVWLRVLKPVLHKPRAACGGGCQGCASSKPVS